MGYPVLHLMHEEKDFLCIIITTDIVYHPYIH
jgi:hypothetical protein